jgi:hypothetical protein
MAFEIGDRVSTQIEIGKPERKQGTVVERYKSRQSTYSASFWLYSVRWDGGDTKTIGHLEVSLEKTTGG